MTPEEKAKELLIKYIPYTNVALYAEFAHDAKQCALIAVDEILNIQVVKNGYWQQVKEEIEKL